MNYKTIIPTIAAGAMLAGCSSASKTQTIYEGPATTIYNAAQMAEVEHALGIKNINNMSCDETKYDYGTHTKCVFNSDDGVATLRTNVKNTWANLQTPAKSFSIEKFRERTTMNTYKPQQARIDYKNPNYEQLKAQMDAKLGSLLKVNSAVYERVAANNKQSIESMLK
jgi:hypothetical protein